MLGRILRADWPRPRASKLAADRSWLEWTTLRLQPRHGLSEAQQRAVRLEYGMTGNHVTLRVRRAMLDATLMHLRLPPADGRKILPMLEVAATKNRKAS